MRSEARIETSTAFRMEDTDDALSITLYVLRNYSSISMIVTSFDYFIIVATCK